QIRALLQAGEDVLELHHAGIGEHQRRVVDRHERRRRHDRVIVAGEEVEESRPDLVDAAHRSRWETPLSLRAALVAAHGRPQGAPLHKGKCRFRFYRGAGTVSRKGAILPTHAARLVCTRPAALPTMPAWTLRPAPPRGSPSGCDPAPSPS